MILSHRGSRGRRMMKGPYSHNVPDMRVFLYQVMLHAFLVLYWAVAAALAAVGVAAAGDHRESVRSTSIYMRGLCAKASALTNKNHASRTTRFACSRLPNFLMRFTYSFTAENIQPAPVLKALIMSRREWL